MEGNSERFLYETLTPLSFSAATATADHPPPPSDDLDTYAVFRNEITLAAASAASPDSSVVDFFSLDVRADGSGPLPPTPPRPRAVEPKTPAREAEPRLESGWFRGDCKFRSPMLQLHKEIVDFCEFLSPTPEEQESRNQAIKGVFDVIKYIWPNCKVEVFGSFKTGLYLPSSDIDVVILGSGIAKPQQGLVAISRALSQRSMAKKIQVIAKARVPIIKFVEKRSGFSFDISFDLQNGPMAAEYIQDAVSKLPPLRPLCLILKVFLQQRELNEVYTGGLGSYALLTMLMAMLRSLKEPEQNLGILLVSFFDFYGRKLNTSDVGVSCNAEGTFFSKSSKGFGNNARPFIISIEDPQAPDNDIGKNSFNYFQIRSAFAMAFTTLTNPKTIMALGQKKSILGTIIRPDSVLLKRKGGSNGQVTFNSLLPGAGEAVDSQYGNQEMLCNWRLDDDEPLPRGGGSDADANANGHSSGKKRKSSSKEKSGKKKKVNENGETSRSRNRESGSRKDRSEKKQRRRHHGDDPNGYGPKVSRWDR